MAIKVGRWDCPTCETKAILGPETNCPGCGSPRPKNVEFYLPDDAETVNDEARLTEAKAGADWVCSHCEGHNKARKTVCGSCGSSREDKGEGDKELAVKDVLNIKKPSVNPRNENSDGNAFTNRMSTISSRIGGSFNSKGALKIVAGLGLGILALYFIFSLKSEKQLTVTAHHWQRQIDLQEYKMVEEQDWQVPSGGTQTGSSKEIHHYNEVQDGTKEVSESVQVKSGTETYVCEKIDKGNGYFEEKKCTRDIYKTEQRKKRVPNMKQVPVYQTKYRYNIMRWKERQAAVARGDGKNGIAWPNMPAGVPADKLKENGRTETYSIDFKDQDGNKTSAEIPQKLWQDTPEGGKLKADKATVTGNYSNFRK